MADNICYTKFKFQICKEKIRSKDKYEVWRAKYLAHAPPCSAWEPLYYHAPKISYKYTSILKFNANVIFFKDFASPQTLLNRIDAGFPYSTYCC